VAAMNGRDLTLGLVGALALGAALGRARGSRSAAAEMGWTQEPVILLQEPIRKRGRVSGDTGLWLRAQRMDYPDGRQLAVFVLEDPDADTSTQDEGDEAVLGYVLADDAQIYSRILPACADTLADLRRRGIVRGLYLVGNTELDSRLHGRGIGSAMYDALIRAAWSDRYAVSPHWCAPRGSVSDAAMRVWSKLARRYPHLGDPDYMSAEEDDHDPEALAQAGTPVIVWGGGGSPNRAPATDAALRTLRAAMVKAARADTAYAPAKWAHATDPLTGHCHAVAHVVHDRFGGELVKGTVKGQAHAWNRLPDGREVDLSGSQYGGDGLHPLAKGKAAPWPKTTNPRFARFAARVDAQLGRR